MPVIQYFAYGSNMLAERLRARCPSAKPRGAAGADNYELAFCKSSQDGSGKATIALRPAAECRMFGVVFDLDDSELPKLDRFEGIGKGYNRIDGFRVLIAGSREPLSVVTYIADPAFVEQDLKPYDWYLKLVVAGARQNLLPTRYIEAIEAIPSIGDPNSDRVSRQEALKLLDTSQLPLPDDTRIAGQKTVRDWKITKEQLIGCNGPAIWQNAFTDFFKARLDSRYFKPIKALEQIADYDGEGFAIVTLHCSSIEFLAATLEGKTYKYQRNGRPPLAQFEYSNSSDMFVRFLESNEPFRGMFSAPGTARDFYSSVRCGLLHEARTKGRWRIQVNLGAKQAIDTDTKVIYRNMMQAAFNQFVDSYGQQLSENAELRLAFVRKFDNLCKE